MSARLGVLSIHLDGAPCAIGCPFCYLGGRRELVPLGRRGGVAPAPRRHGTAELLRAAESLDYAELAIALSEPADPGEWAATRATLQQLLAAAAARGRPGAVTTTPQVVLHEPSLLRGASRLNLSVDPWKLPSSTPEGRGVSAAAFLAREARGAPAAAFLARDARGVPAGAGGAGGADLPGDEAGLLAAVERAAALARGEGAEAIAIATLSTPAFAEALVSGLLARLVALPSLAGVAMNALKPPPPFCDRAFWLDALARLRPLLDRELDRRVHLDCYVAARLLGIGGCPARPDLSPAGAGAERHAFRACVYAAAPDLELDSIDELGPTLAAFEPPARCPFDTRLDDASAKR
jgi:hypothetical protein